MKVLVVEDDFHIAQQICEFLKNMSELKLRVLSPCYSFSQALTCLESEKPDLALLDIQLGSDTMGGINLAEMLQKFHNIPIIFITGLPDKVGLNRALHIKWSAFLKKPISLLSLKKAVEQVLLQDGSTQKTIFFSDSSEKESLWFRSKGGILTSIKVHDIAVVVSTGHYCQFYTIQGEGYPYFNARLRKDVYDKQLSLYDKFYLLGRSYILNMEAIAQIDQNHVKFATLPFKIPIPKGKQPEILDRLDLIN